MPPLTDMPDRGMAKMKEQSLRFAFEVLFIPEAQEIMAKAYLTNEGIRKKIDHVAGLFEVMFHQGAKYERLRQLATRSESPF